MAVADCRWRTDDIIESANDFIKPIHYIPPKIKLATQEKDKQVGNEKEKGIRS